MAYAAKAGMVRGVCAGIADYLDVPVTGAYSGRAVDFLGWRFFTVVAYIVLSFVLTLCR